MNNVTLRSKRLLTRYKRADKVCRELRFLIARDGMVSGLNCDKICKLLFSWQRATGKDWDKRP